jgi:phage terminase large subunit-like protein
MSEIPSWPKPVRRSLEQESITTTPSWCPVDYQELMTYLLGLPVPDRKTQLRKLVRTDLYFLLRYLMGRPDIEHPWMYARCREIQEAPDGYLDLWARDHRKSTIITFAKTIQDILAAHGEEPLPHWNGMEPTFGIFSHTRGIALAFVQQIKTELEQNEALHTLFPDVLYEKPEREAPRWSVQNGLTVKRKSNPKEATIEGWGLVDGQPTSKHFNVLLYDDVVVMASVTTPEMIQKTTTAWEFSLNLGDRSPRIRGAGTRWHFADTYRTILERQALLPRIHAATDDATLTGKPIFLTPEELQKKIRDMGPYSASSQLLLNPIADSKQTFKRDWLEHRYQSDISWQPMTRVLLCDPANAKVKKSDYTTMAVIGLGEDRNYYLLDFLRDRLNLVERSNEYFRLHRKWRPHKSAYEEYGKDSDIQHLQTIMSGGNGRPPYHFEIEVVAGALSKYDRINRLIPVCSEGRLWLPDAIYRTNSEGKLEELMQILIEMEFLAWPVPVHDDGMDVISRVFDVEDLQFP